MKEVKIYSTSTCPYCRMAKEHMALKNISYKNIDVSSDQSAAEEMARISGQMSVPVIVIDHEIIVGFDKSRIDSLLKE